MHIGSTRNLDTLTLHKYNLDLSRHIYIVVNLCLGALGRQSLVSVWGACDSAQNRSRRPLHHAITFKGYQDTDFSWSTERIQVVGHFISPYTKKLAIISDTNLKN